MECVLGPSTAVCVSILDGSIPEIIEEPTGRFPMAPINGTEFTGNYQTYTITGGLEKLSVATATTTPVGGLSDGPAETGSPGETVSPTETGKKSGGISLVPIGMRSAVAGVAVFLGGLLL